MHPKSDSQVATAQLDQLRKESNSLDDRLMQLREAWDNKLFFPLTELGKRYLRKNFSIALDCSMRQSQLGAPKKFSLAISSNGTRCIDPRTGGNGDARTRGDNREFSMLIKSVHVVDDAEGVIFSIAPSFVGLHLQDERVDPEISNPLYFSFVSGNFIFRNRLFLEDRELDSACSLGPVLDAGKMPNNVIQARTQVMNDLAAQDPTAQRDDEVSMIINRFLPLLRIYIGNDWILASSEEAADLPTKIDDVLIGPF